LRLFFWDEHFGRATTVFENHHGGWWYYPAAIAVGFFPWSMFLVPMLLGIDRRLSKRHPLSMSLIFLLCWIGVQVAVFSVAATKLPSYVTPCFPALALCCGSYLERWAREKDRLPQFWDKAVYAAIGGTGVCISIALAIVCAKFLHGSYWLAALGVPWIAAAGYGWFLPANHRPRHWVVGFALSALAFSVGLFGFGAPSVARLQQAQCLLDPLQFSGTQS
jgi:4-amino-4-deoxy-L-arabinose transferase-like glycosyltransferase